jgi:thiol-disulfide isomerase/thioredoxin
MKHFIALPFLILISLLFVACTQPKNPGALVTAGLLDYDLTMVQGSKPEHGKPLVIEFWATWCGPCHKLFPHLTELTEDLKGTGIQFVAVTNESFNLIQEFVRVRQLKYPIAVDIKDLYGRALNVSYIPFAVIVNANGDIVWSGHSGKLSKERIEKALMPKNASS